MTSRLKNSATALCAELDRELSLIDSCLAALGPDRPAVRRPPPPACRKKRKAALVTMPRGDGMAGVQYKRRAGTPKPKDGRCDVCGRADIDRGAGGVVPFHYAPEPCGLVCAGGASIGKPEDRADGLHSRSNCPRCKRSESKTA